MWIIVLTAFLITQAAVYYFSYKAYKNLADPTRTNWISVAWRGASRGVRISRRRAGGTARSRFSSILLRSRSWQCSCSCSVGYSPGRRLLHHRSLEAGAGEDTPVPMPPSDQHPLRHAWAVGRRRVMQQCDHLTTVLWLITQPARLPPPHRLRLPPPLRPAPAPPPPAPPPAARPRPCPDPGAVPPRPASGRRARRFRA